MNEAVAMATQDPRLPRKRIREVTFDTDSNAIGFDNRCSACISNKIEDFEGPVKLTNRTIKAFAEGKVANVYSRTLVWNWLDDNGSKHKFRIPKSYYVPDGGCRLLSPQHWAKSQTRCKKNQLKYGEITYKDRSILFWGDNRLTKPLGKDDNVATFHIAPGYDRFELFCQECRIIFCQECRIEVDEELSKPELICQPAVQDVGDDVKVK